MSIFTKMRNAFGGGVSIKIEMPRDFAWEDKVIPVQVHVTGHGTEPRVIDELRFHFFDEKQGTRSNSGEENGINYHWVMDDPIDVPAGASVTETVEMPLPFDVDAIAEASAELGQGSSMTEKVLGSIMRGAMRPPTHIEWFRTSVAAKVEGARFTAKASKKLRCRNARGHFSVGPVRF
ncbi:hypothetical protein [Microbacterium sp. YY-01]|uniref:hypothetical protein n=1 Tax=Microbacterium sp. YY-01 TaxID=3421634 RepID=UPI003D1707EF